MHSTAAAPKLAGRILQHIEELRRPQNWLRGRDLNPRPSGYEPDELPGCSTPRLDNGTMAAGLAERKPKSRDRTARKEPLAA